MIIRLTKRQYEHVLKAVEHDEPMREALTEDVREQPGNARVDVIAPYAAWACAREDLLDRAFNDRGYRRNGVPSSVQAAVKTMSQALGHIDRHPAMKDSAVFGHHGSWFPVWEVEPDRLGRRFHPYPQPGRPFHVLGPVWAKQGNTKLTYWRADGLAPGASHLILEDTHLRLWREHVALATLRNPQV